MTLVQRLVALVVAALLPVLAAVSHGLSSLRDAQDAAQQRDAQRIARMIGAQHRDAIAGAMELLPSISAQAARIVESREACEGLRAGVPPPSRRVVDIFVLDAAGMVRCATQDGAVGTSRATMPEVAQALARDGLARRTLEASTFAADPILPIAQSWRAPGGGAHGVVLLVLRPGPAVVPMVQATLPGWAASLIVDRAGRVLYAVPGLPAGRLGAPPPTLAELLPHVRPGADRGTWLDGGERVLAWDTLDPVGMPGVRVVVGIDISATGAELDRARQTMIWVVVATLGGAILVAFWGGVSFIRAPLGVLRRAALRWRDGDRSARVRLPGRTEIADLGRVFDEMAEATESGERRLRESAELVNGLIESSADGIFVTDLEGRFLLVNSTYARLMGRERAELTGLRGADLLPADMRARAEETERAVLAEMAPRVCDLVLPVAPSPSLTPSIGQGAASLVLGPGLGPGMGVEAQRVLHVIYAPVMSGEGGQGGRVSAIAGIARDVTAEREAATELRAAKDRAETADQSKTRFLAAASHDLRQPLQAAVLFASLLTEPGLLTEKGRGEARRTAEQLRAVLDDLRAMLDSLFDVSRYDAQVVQPDIVPVRLQPLIEQVVAAAGTGARAKGIAIHARPTEAWVRSDRALLARMLGNIVENAVRYTATGSVTIACAPRDGQLRIDIRDTGRGIAAEDLARIWQEFEQLHNPERDRRQGLGLGLAIVRRLSRLLGHPVSVESTPGIGSVFSIDVPIAEAPALLPAVHVAAPVTGNGGLAVVVEDDAALLSVLGMILEEHGWTVLSAGDDNDLIPRLAAASEAPAVILTDYRLRGGRLGSDAIQAIRAQAGSQIPAIILTGEISDEDEGTDGPMTDAKRLGNVSVLRKPVGAADLVAAVGRVARKDAA